MGRGLPDVCGNDLLQGRAMTIHELHDKPDPERIQRLKAAIERGEYTVDAHAVAGAIVDRLIAERRDATFPADGLPLAA